MSKECITNKMGNNSIEDEQMCEELSHRFHLSNSLPPDVRTELNSRYELYGWAPSEKLSKDENYMDLVMLLTRNSTCRQGHMGCVIVGNHTDKDENMFQVTNQDEKKNSADFTNSSFYDNIIGAGTNLELYRKFDSDIHAEQVALGDASKKGNCTMNSIAYVTMAPCKRCFASLLSAGVERIVCRQAPPEIIAKVAEKHQIQFVDMKYQANEQDDRISAITSIVENTEEKLEEIARLRRERKIEQKIRKEKRKLQADNHVIK